VVVFWSDYAIFQGITIDIINSQYVLKRVHKYGHKLHNVFSQAATVTKSAVGIPNNLLYLQKVFESQQFKKKRKSISYTYHYALSVLQSANNAYE